MGGTNRQGENAKGAASLTGRKPESEGRSSRRDYGSRMLDSASEMRGGFRAVGVAASKLAVPIVAKRGGGILVRLKREWSAIVGRDWAEVAWPIALGRDGVLKLHAASGAALELQHRAPLLIERLNLFFGRPVVTRLALVQGPLPLAAASSAPRIRPLAPNEERALDRQLAAVADPELRTALAKLGRAVSGGREH
jgi:hypothetical protein